jgi:hypothetical protein
MTVSHSAREGGGAVESCKKAATRREGVARRRAMIGPWEGVGALQELLGAVGCFIGDIAQTSAVNAQIRQIAVRQTVQFAQRA